MTNEERASLRHFLSAALVFGREGSAHERTMSAFDEWWRLYDSAPPQDSEVVKLRAERDEWAAKWQRMRRKYAELRWPGLTRIITGKDAGGVREDS